MTDQHERELRDAFGALHRDVQASAPQFADLASAPALASARRRRRVGQAAVVMSILILVLVALPLRSSPGFDFERFTTLTGIDPGSVTWQAPSDFLLDVPGHDLLQAVPTVDVHIPSVPIDSVRPPDTNVSPRRSSD